MIPNYCSLENEIIIKSKRLTVHRLTEITHANITTTTTMAKTYMNILSKIKKQ